jgi:hypothetical protein
VTINDAAEQTWVFATFGSYGGVDRSLWIGLTDAGHEGTFTWVSGEPVTYTNWLPGQPDNAYGDENYAHMMRTGNGFGHPGGLWNDLASPFSPFPQFDPIHGVVEVNTVAAVPEPSAFALLGSGMITAAAWCRWRRTIPAESRRRI